MPDWQKVVREHLAGLNLGHEEENEVIAELAGHLEETYETFCGKGMSEQEAMRHALAQVADWKGLHRKIYSARHKEEIMEPRARQFWVPGLLGFSLFLAFSTIAESTSFGWYLGGKLWLVSHPLVLSLGRGTPILRFHIESLVLLFFVGATAAGLSRWAGGTLRTSLLSSVFPSVPFAVVFLVAVPTGLIIGHPISYGIVGQQIVYMALGWVLAPAAALLAGGWLAQQLWGDRNSRQKRSPDYADT
jgi:hypothetical protein